MKDHSLTTASIPVAPTKDGQQVASKRFPIMRPYGLDLTGLNIPESIPWDRLNEEWAQRNHGQSLARLAERGGLDPVEAAANIERRKLRPMFLIDALQVIGCEA